MIEYEKDLNDLKEQILKEGNVLVTKRALLERFCEIDKEYNGEPWNLLQILSNINILIGEEHSENAISRKKIEKLKRWRFSYDTNTTIPKSDLFVRLTDIRALPSVKSTQGWIPVSGRLPKEHIAVLVYCPERKNIYCACYEEKQWWIFGAYFKKIEEDVIAWMPLPKPY